MNAQANPPKADHAFLCGVLFFAFAWACAFVPAFAVWPLPLAIPLAAYTLVVAAIPKLRMAAPNIPVGRAGTPAMAITFVLMLISAGALVAFDAVTHPNVEEYRTFLPVSALGGVASAGVLFSLLNPLFEEVIFRGILFAAVRSQVGPLLTVLITATLFGIAHLHGYPPGPIGAALAFLYGIALGSLRAFTGGLTLPILAHIAADAAIFILIARTGVFSR